MSTLEGRPLVRTDVPGVYSRGTRFVVIWRDVSGRQRKTAAVSLDDAKVKQRELRREAKLARREIVRCQEARRVRASADVGEAYSALRKALQVADAAHTVARGRPRRTLSAAISTLHQAEDELVLAMKELAL